MCSCKAAAAGEAWRPASYWHPHGGRSYQSTSLGCGHAFRFVFRHDPTMRYCLGLAAQRFGVIVHAGCMMSTHSHEVVTDVRGVLPRFLQEFHRLLALSTKALRGWRGEVFDKRSAGQHALLPPEATIEALASLISNQLEAGAVRYAKDWPGAHPLPRDIGARVVKAKRPPYYFDPDNAAWPEVDGLPLEMPTNLELDYGTELAQVRIAERVKQ